ncbi:MAG TPA: O-methyltransferase [Nocardioidaceae bacterium]|nr:O-methyltransferase [Nocardioidaceae bacterium]
MSRTTKALTPELHDYLLRHNNPQQDDVLRELADETADVLPDDAGMQIAPEQGAFMTLLTRTLNVRYAVEVGTFTGYSSLCIARGLADGGRLLCCDVSEEFTAIARRYWERAGVADRIELRLAPGVETLRSLPADPPIDLAFIDADKEGYVDYWEEILTRMRPGGVVLVDNVFSNGRVVADDPGPTGNAIKRFNDHAAADDRVELAMLPIADGLTFARKR